MAEQIRMADLDRKGLWGVAYGREVWAIGEDLTMFSAGHDLRALAAALHEYRGEIGYIWPREVSVRRRWVHFVDGCGCVENCPSCHWENGDGCWTCPDCRSEEMWPCGPDRGWTAKLFDTAEECPTAEPVWAVTAADRQEAA